MDHWLLIPSDYDGGLTHQEVGLVEDALAFTMRALWGNPQRTRPESQLWYAYERIANKLGLALAEARKHCQRGHRSLTVGK